MKALQAALFLAVAFGEQEALALSAPMPPMETGATSTPNLTGTGWIVQSINGEPLRDGAPVARLRFTDAQIAVSTGCRHFRASLTPNGRGPRFRVIQEPMIAIQCNRELEDRELALGRIIHAATRIHRSDGTHLSITSPLGGFLTAKRID